MQLGIVFQPQALGAKQDALGMFAVDLAVGHLVSARDLAANVVVADPDLLHRDAGIGPGGAEDLDQLTVFE